LHDVIVIGGGPIGSYTASRLAKEGYEVLVLDKKLVPGEGVCCTGIISRECVNKFNIDEGIMYHAANSAVIYSPGGSAFKVHRDETQVYIVNRSAFDRVMVAKARHNGAEYQFGAKVENIVACEDGVEIDMSCGGERIQLSSRAVVLASGFSLPFTKKAELGGYGDFAIGAQAEVKVNKLEEVEIYTGQDIAPGFFGWLVPTSSHKALVGVMCRHKPGQFLKKLISLLEKRGKIITSEIEYSYGGIPLKPLPMTYGDRLLVVGDAAGHVKPLTGGGIYYGLLCADIAVDTLSGALKDDNLSSENLAGYQTRWQKLLGRELRISSYARKFYERLSDRRIEKVLRIMRSGSIYEELGKADDLHFDWHSNVVLRILKLLGKRFLIRPVDLVKLLFS